MCRGLRGRGPVIRAEDIDRQAGDTQHVPDRCRRIAAAGAVRNAEHPLVSWVSPEQRRPGVGEEVDAPRVLAGVGGQVRAEGDHLLPAQVVRAVHGDAELAADAAAGAIGRDHPARTDPAALPGSLGQQGRLNAGIGHLERFQQGPRQQPGAGVTAGMFPQHGLEDILRDRQTAARADLRPGRGRGDVLAGWCAGQAGPPLRARGDRQLHRTQVRLYAAHPQDLHRPGMHPACPGQR